VDIRAQLRGDAGDIEVQFEMTITDQALPPPPRRMPRMRRVAGAEQRQRWLRAALGAPVYHNIAHRATMVNPSALFLPKALALTQRVGQAPPSV